MRRFDEEVKDKTSNEVYDAYIQIVLENYHNNISNQEFKEKLGELLQGYPTLLELLPVFFSEIDEPPAHHQLTRPSAQVENSIINTTTPAMPATSQSTRPGGGRTARRDESRAALVQ